jgi:hypothetical protein
MFDVRKFNPGLERKKIPDSTTSAQFLKKFTRRNQWFV